MNIPLFLNNQPLKQQFHQEVSISITGEDGDLLYAKEVENTLVGNRLG